LNVIFVKVLRIKSDFLAKELTVPFRNSKRRLEMFWISSWLAEVFRRGLRIISIDLGTSTFFNFLKI